MTILELMVASTIALFIVGMTVSTTVVNRDAYGYDIVRTRLNQNLRSAFDVINTEVRQAGERLPGSFPAIEIVDGASGAPDTLILRRNLLDEVLTVCQTLTTASGPDVYLTSSAAGTPPVCVFGTQTANFNAWHSYRIGSAGGTSHVVRSYIFDFTTKLGQFFNYSSDNTSGTTQTIRKQSGSWAGTYTGLSASVYMLSEWKFQLSTTPGSEDLLQLVENQDTANPKNVVYGVKNIQFRALMQDGTSKTTFTKNDNWSQIRAIEVTISGSDKFRDRVIDSTLTTQLFPRNVLSN
ncbi:MAG: hypothetical protein U0136_15450 [Bdellovibrionota bacterium]